MANNNPIYYGSYPSYAFAMTAAAAADYDGAAATLLNAGSASGSMDLIWIKVTPVDTTTLGNVVRVFKKTGGVKVPIGDAEIPLMTKVATGSWRRSVYIPVFGEKLNGAAEELYISQEKADKLQALAQYGAYFTS